MEELFQHITINTDINTPRSHRNILQINHQCNRYNYNGNFGFLVKIGAKRNIEIPFNMLEQLYNDAVKNNGIYNKAVFFNRYPDQFRNHDCHVHVVGMLLARTRLVVRKNAREYTILIIQN